MSSSPRLSDVAFGVMLFLVGCGERPTEFTSRSLLHEDWSYHAAAVERDEAVGYRRVATERFDAEGDGEAFRRLSAEELRSILGDVVPGGGATPPRLIPGGGVRIDSGEAVAALYEVMPAQNYRALASVKGDAQVVVIEMSAFPGRGEYDDPDETRRLIAQIPNGAHRLDSPGYEVDFFTSDATYGLLMVAMGGTESVGMSRFQLSQQTLFGAEWKRPPYDDAHPYHRRIEAVWDHREAVALWAPGSLSCEVDVGDDPATLRFEVAEIAEETSPPLKIRVNIASTSDKAESGSDFVLNVGRSGWWPGSITDARLRGRVRITLQAEPNDPDVDPAHVSAGVAFANVRVERGVRPAPSPPDVVLISLDTIRADHLGLYGAPSDPAPNLSRFASDAAVFDACVSNGAYTLPSHASLMTGAFVDRHGVIGPGRRIDASRSPLLATALRRKGYETIAYTGGGYLDPTYGFSIGFDRYSTFDPGRDPNGARVPASPRYRRRMKLLDSEESTRARLLAELASPSDHPRFFFLHTYAAHNYVAPREELKRAGVSDDRIEAWIDDKSLVDFARLAGSLSGEPDRIEELSRLYDASIGVADRFFGDVIAALSASGRLDDTLIVVVSDHGEELYEHGGFGHGATLYEEMIRVPLIIRGPAVRPARIDGVVSLADVAPTILALVGESAPKEVDGRDISAWLSGDEVSPTPAIAVADHRTKGRIRSLRGRGWKLIADEREGGELYFLGKDGGEHNDRSVSNPVRFRKLLEGMRERVAALRRESGSGGATEIDDGMRQALRELGYVE